MKIIKAFILIYILSTIGIYSQTVVWKTETQDKLSAKTFDSLLSVNASYSFVTDDNRLVLLGYIKRGNLFNLYSLNAYPFIRIFNASTGQAVKEELFGSSHEYIRKIMDTTYSFVGDSLDSASVYDEQNWIRKIDTTFDTLHFTVQYPMKTINVDKEYWFICFNTFYLNSYCVPVPYLVRMDEDFNIIEKIDKVTIDNNVKTAPESLVSSSSSLFYDDNKKCFILFAPFSDTTIIIKQFDTSFNYLGQIEKNVILNLSDIYLRNSGSLKLIGERLDNGNYVVWTSSSFLSSDAKYMYSILLHQLYDPEFNLIKEQKRVRDDEKGYKDSGILKIPSQIIKNSNTGGYFVYLYSNTGILLEEYAANGDSLRTIYFDVAAAFPELKSDSTNISYSTEQVLYRDGKFTFVGIKRVIDEKAVEAVSDSVYRTVYLVETDYDGEIIWQYKVPTVYTGDTPEVILGEDANTYYISGVNVTGDPKLEFYELGYYNYNFIVMKIDHNSSIAEDNQFSDLMIAPNPVSSTFTVDYTLEKTGLLSITITDLLGKQVSEEYNNYVEAGTFTKTINIEDLLPGVYYLNILHNGKIIVKKIIKN